MRRTMLMTGAAILFWAATGLADGVVNGSFEDDEWIRDLAAQDPNAWDVNLPSGKFRGYVLSDWPTEGQYNLTVHSEWFVPFVAGDMAMVSQPVVLADAGQIIFDVKLDTLGFTPWDPNVCSAVVLLDDEVVWESSFPEDDIRGEYLDQVIIVDRQYHDGQPHRLTLGLRMNGDGMLFERYVAHWDTVECTLACDGGGLLPGDFNADCFVDADDVMLMSAMWLADVVSQSPYNLSTIDDQEGNGIVNFYDLAVFGDSWRGSSLAQEE